MGTVTADAAAAAAGCTTKLVTPVLQVVHRAITRFLLDQAALKAEQADGGAVTLIQRFGSAANLNIHLHCLVLDGVYRRTDGDPVFVEVSCRLRTLPCKPQLPYEVRSWGGKTAFEFPILRIDAGELQAPPIGRAADGFAPLDLVFA